MPPIEALPKAKTAALKAIQLDESLAEPHVSLAHVSYFYDRDWPRAEREFKRSIELNPNYRGGPPLVRDLFIYRSPEVA